MFDIGFWEMVLVGVVALLVFGPERLPRVARETALWLRKGRTMVASVKQDIDRELQLHELQEALRREKQSLATLGRDEQPAALLDQASDGRNEETSQSHAEANDQTGGR